jgi:hypothetical protein
VCSKASATSAYISTCAYEPPQPPAHDLPHQGFAADTAAAV